MAVEAVVARQMTRARVAEAAVREVLESAPIQLLVAMAESRMQLTPRLRGLV